MEAGTPILTTNQSQNATQYSWYINGQLTSTVANPSFTLNTQGWYQIQLVVSNGDSLCGTSESFQWVEVTCPVESEIAPMAFTGYLPGDTLEIVATSGFASLTWSDGSSGASLAVTQPGSYWVEALSINGCSYSDTVEVGLCMVANDPELPAGIGVFPNPTCEVCWIETTINSPVEWQLFNAFGQDVGISGKVENPGKHQIALNGLAEGAYSLRIQSGNQVWRWSLVVAR